jgi:hypothetical protein
MLLPLLVLLLFGFGCLSGALDEWYEGKRNNQTLGAIVVFGGAFFGTLSYIIIL